MRASWSVLSVLAPMLLAGCLEPPAERRIEPAGGLDRTGSDPPPGNETIPDPEPPAPSVNESVVAGNDSTQPRVLGTGHIAIGSPHTNIRSVSVLVDGDSVDGFFLPAPESGVIVSTTTADNGGLGYDLSINFHDADRRYLGGCATAAPDETCEVPQGASTVEVVAALGRDLDVTVFVFPVVRALSG